MNKKYWMLILSVFLLSGCFQSQKAANNVKAEPNQSKVIEKNSINDKDSTNMKTLTLHIKESKYTITLSESVTSQQFLSILPLDLTMQDMNNNEKYQYLNQQLTMQAEPVERIQAGDLMLYGNDCIVLFYESFPTTYQYTKLGHIDDESFLTMLRSNETLSIRFTSP